MRPPAPLGISFWPLLAGAEFLDLLACSCCCPRCATGSCATVPSTRLRFPGKTSSRANSVRDALRTANAQARVLPGLLGIALDALRQMIRCSRSTPLST